MYYLNKFVWFVLSPATPLLALMLAAAFAAWRGRRRLAVACSLVGAFLLWALSCSWLTAALGLPLERPYVATESVESLPKADAIVALGGGMCWVSDRLYPNMSSAADRLWHAARLYKAGKAPRVIVSGAHELEAAVPVLVEMGVPREAILVDNDSRNTYENARFTERLLDGKGRILLVTSAWHMTRARGNFAKTSLEVIPAATDFDAHASVTNSREAGYWWFVTPNVQTLAFNSYYLKEWIGRLARK